MRLDLVEMPVKYPLINEVACTTRAITVSYNTFQCKLGHPNERATKATEKQLGLKVDDTLPDYLC